MKITIERQKSAATTDPTMIPAIAPELKPLLPLSVPAAELLTVLTVDEIEPVPVPVPVRDEDVAVTAELDPTGGTADDDVIVRRPAAIFTQRFCMSTVANE